MKNTWLLVALFSISMVSFAAEPSTESLEKLFVVTETSKLVQEMEQHMDTMLETGMQRALKGKAMTPEMRSFADNFKKKVIASFKEDLSWETQKPMYIQIYKESFTQSEIDGLIAFYEGPTGKAFVKKMPLVMQKTMGIMQQKMGPWMDKMERLLKEAQREAEAINNKKSSG